MKLITIFCDKIKKNVSLQINSDNILDGDYFKCTFPYATGIICKAKDRGFFFRSTTPYALMDLIGRAHHRVRVRASTQVEYARS